METEHPVRDAIIRARQDSIQVSIALYLKVSRIEVQRYMFLVDKRQPLSSDIGSLATMTRIIK
jgi:hypothetical protein